MSDSLFAQSVISNFPAASLYEWVRRKQRYIDGAFTGVVLYVAVFFRIENAR